MRSLVLSVAISASACGGSDVGSVVGPPPPPPPPDTMPARAAFDLRFKGVGVLSSTNDVNHTNIDVTTGSALQFTFANVSGTPLEIGPGACGTADCAWFFDVYRLPATMDSLTTRYTGSVVADLPDLVGTAATDTVVTSLDVERSVGVFGASEYIADTLGGYMAKEATVPAGDFTSAASADGATGRVITALSFDDGSVRYLSYTWPNDSGAVYDVQVSATPFSGIASAAQTLVDAGFVVTAFGGNVTNGFLLVGTRVHGATPQHTLIVGPTTSRLDGYAVVGYVVDSLNSPTILYEK